MNDAPNDFEAQLAQLKTQVADLQARQLIDESKLKKLAKYSRDQTVVAGVLICAVASSVLGLDLSQEYREAFKGVLTTIALGALVAPRATEGTDS
jgi:hypothetical protein